MNEWPVELWAKAFGWTLAIEVPLYLMMLVRPLGPWRAFAAALLVNVLTHPALWYLFPYFEPYETYVVVAELCVWTVETVVLWPILSRWSPLGRPLLYALIAAFIANLVSTVAGLFIM